MNVNKWIEKFCLGIIDEIYDRGYSMTKDQVEKLHDDVLEIARKVLQDK